MAKVSQQPAETAYTPDGDIGDAFRQLAEAFAQLFGALPQWALTVLILAAAAVVGIFVVLRLRRGGDDDDLILAAADDHTADDGVAKSDGRPPPAPENPPLRAYRQFLEKRGVAAKEQDAMIRDFAEIFRDVRQNLRDLGPGDADLDGRVELARAALNDGEFVIALDHLHTIGDGENAAGRAKRDESARHLSAAAMAMSVAADLHMLRMEYEAAAALFGQAADILPPVETERLAEIHNKQGTAHYQAGNHGEAIRAFENAMNLTSKRLGKNHPDVAAALNNLALLHYSQGNYAAAEPLYQQSLAIDEHALGIDHPGVATDLNNLALLYKKQGNLEAAEPLLERALAIKEKNFDPGHPSLVTGLTNYAAVLRSMGRDADAEPYEKRATTLPPSRIQAD